MRHRRRGRKLSRSAAHRDALYMNLAAALIQHGRITTTLAKAKEMRPYVERMVTAARDNSVHSQRTVLKKLRLHDRASSRKAGRPSTMQLLFDEVAPRFADRPGGYTRIVKLGKRPGDAAPMAILEFVDYVPTRKAATTDAEHAHTHDHEHEHAHA